MARGLAVAGLRQDGEVALGADVERQAQGRLAGLLRWIDVLEAELQGIYDTLPAPDAAEADAMEEGERPESLGRYLRTAIECERRDWLPATRAILDRAVAIRQRDLDLEWCQRQRERRTGGR